MSFRATARRLAAEISSTTGTSCASSAANPAAELLPPLPLYRRLLRVHRKVLPNELRVMGDEYIKAEFRRTKSADNPLHIVGFLGEWKKYLDFHEEQLPSSSAPASDATLAAAEQERKEQEQWERAKLGQKLDPAVLETLSADQIGQLFELFQASKDAFNPDAQQRPDVEGVPADEVLPNLEAAAKGMQRRNEKGE